MSKGDCEGTYENVQLHTPRPQGKDEAPVRYTAPRKGNLYVDPHSRKLLNDVDPDSQNVRNDLINGKDPEPVYEEIDDTLKKDSAVAATSLNLGLVQEDARPTTSRAIRYTSQRPGPLPLLPVREGVPAQYGRQWQKKKKKKRCTICLAIVLVILALLLAIGVIGVVVGVALKTTDSASRAGPCKVNGTDGGCPTDEDGDEEVHNDDKDEKGFKGYSMNYIASYMTTTKDGDIAMVERVGMNVAIVNPSSMTVVRNIWIHSALGLWGIARAGDLLYVTDHSSERIHVINQTQWTVTGSLAPGLVQMYGIAVDSEQGEAVWVTTREQGVYKLTVDHQRQKIISKELIVRAHTNMKHPMAVTVSGGRAIVACGNSFNVHVFSTHGSSWYYKTIGRKGTGNGMFLHPISVTQDPNGNFYVADFQANRVTMFSGGGAFVRNLVTDKNGMFSVPTAILYSGGKLFVANQKLTVFVITLE